MNLDVKLCYSIVFLLFTFYNKLHNNIFFEFVLNITKMADLRNLPIGNDQQLETFLIQAQLVQKKIQDLANNKISVEEFDRLEKLREQDRQRRQNYKKRKEQEALQLKKKGISGKGIGKNFKHFCKFCHLQYQFDTIKCLKCDRNTLTLQQRQKQLSEMVEEYKCKKKRKQERKQKWEMWKKTKAMMWKKTSTNFNKWEVYTSSEDQQIQDSQPIVPKDDPNFKALELDMLQRKKKRQIDSKKANDLKDKGNKAMKQGDYQKAMQCYTLALQHIKDNKTIYTNRALAFIKLKKYKKAIKDCDDVLDYIDCFQKFNQCPDLAYKAYSRKAIAHKERKQYKEALEAINNALKMIPNDVNALKQKKQIENFYQHSKKTEQILRKQGQQRKAQNKQEQQQQQKKQELKAQFTQSQIIKQLAEKQRQQQIQKQKQNKNINGMKQANIVSKQNQQINDPIEFIKKSLKEINQQNIDKTLNLLLKNADYKTIFISAGGIKLILKYILERSRESKGTILLSYIMQNNGVAQKQIWDYGFQKIQIKCQEILSKQSKLQDYLFLQDIFQLIVPISLHEKYRQKLSKRKQTVEFINFCYLNFITKYKKYTNLLSSFLIYCSNLCVGQSWVKIQFEKKIDIICASLYRILQEQTKNRKLLELNKNIYNLLSNLLTNQNIRENFYKQKDIITLLVQRLKTFPRVNPFFKQSVESMLSFFVNITFNKPKSETLLLLKELSLHTVCYNRFLFDNQDKKCQIFIRAIQVLSKLDYINLKIQKEWIKKFENLFDEVSIKQNYTTHAIRFFNNIYITNPDTQLPRLEKISKILEIQTQILFCNTCTLFGVWIEIPKHSKNAQNQLKKYIVRLINIAKQKIGNLRKSSAILLAKISKDEQNKQILIQNHGMDVLKSVANFVLDKR